MEPTQAKPDPNSPPSSVMPIVYSVVATVLVCSLIAGVVGVLWSDAVGYDLQKTKDDLAKTRKELDDFKKGIDDKAEREAKNVLEAQRADMESRARERERIAREESEMMSRERAAKDVKKLEMAVGAWKRLYGGVLPESLQQLVQPRDDGPAILEKRALIDPWDQPYHYDPSQLHPVTGVPRIWSDGPPDQKEPISNW
jgi:hypothetical protein